MSKDSPTVASLFKTCNDMGAGSMQQVFGDGDGNPIAYVLACVEPDFIQHLRLIVDAWHDSEDATLPALMRSVMEKMCEGIRLFEIVEDGEVYAARSEAEAKALWQSSDPQSNTDEIYEATDVTGDERYATLLREHVGMGLPVPAQIATCYA